MAEWKINGNFLTEVQKRQRKSLTAAALFYLKLMAETLSNGLARHGRRYDFYKGNLWPLDLSRSGVSSDGVTRFFTRFGKVIPMREPSGGWVVRGRVHVASATGEAPALLTGDLRRRSSYTIQAAPGGDLLALAGSSVPYAKRLEGAMERPAWALTMRAVWDQIQAVFSETFAHAA